MGGWAVLHRVTATLGGPIDSVRTDAAGRYAFPLADVDTGVVFFVSADHHGIGYFSTPIRLETGPRVEVAPLVVYDTASTGPAIVLQRRLVTVGLPGKEGSREVLELLELRNPDTRTRISPDSVRPVWAGTIPPEASQFRVGESDMSPAAVFRLRDSIAVFAALPPDRTHQLTVQYYLPGDAWRLSLAVSGFVQEFDVLLEDTAATVGGAPLVRMETQSIEGRRFAAYRADSLVAGAVVTVAFSAAPFRFERLVPWVAGVAAVALVWGLLVAFRRPSGGARRPAA